MHLVITVSKASSGLVSASSCLKASETFRRSDSKKSAISADLLDTANTYEDKVALIRMLVQEDSGRVANVLKGMVRQR